MKNKDKKDKKKNANHKLLKIPHKFQTGFLGNLDERTVIFQHLKTIHTEILDDLGGKNSLSHLQIGLVERAVFLEFTVRYLENAITKVIVEHSKIPSKLYHRWLKGTESLLRLTKTLGLKRRKGIDISLKPYLEKEKKKNA